MEIIVGRKGDQPFAITDKAVSGRHLKLSTMPDGCVQVEDLGSSNGTFIDDVRVIKKVVNRDTVVRMGPTYTFCIKNVIPEVRQQSASTQSSRQEQVPEYSIRHLKDVWDDYDSEVAQIRDKSQQLGKRRMIPMMISLASGAVSPFVGVGIFFTAPVAAISLGFMIKAYFDKDTSYEDNKAAKNKLIDKYVCPNPNCGRTLPLQDYTIVSQSVNCPYCRCKWIK